MLWVVRWGSLDFYFVVNYAALPLLSNCTFYWPICTFLHGLLWISHSKLKWIVTTWMLPFIWKKNIVDSTAIIRKRVLWIIWARNRNMIFFFFFSKYVLFWLRPQSKIELCMKLLAGDSKLIGFLFVSVFLVSVFHLDTIFDASPHPRMACTLKTCACTWTETCQRGITDTDSVPGWGHY